MIKKSIINELLKTQPLEKIERHLIAVYLDAKKLEKTESSILKAYFDNFKKDPKLYFEISTLNILSIKVLEHYLELLIPLEDRKLNGAFFTPSYIIDFIINEIKPEVHHLTLDLSCGCGAFLVGLVSYYKANFDKTIKSVVQQNIYGSDILAYNIHRTKLILAIYALEHGEILEECDFNLYHQDSLKARWTQQFDVIVGNPPYVKFQDLSIENRDFLSKQWASVEGGTFNLYFAFFELGYNLLKPTGQLGYITPNNYFTSLSGESIRRFFQQKKCISRIIDFSHKKVFDAQTYTAITFLNKKENESILFDRIKEEYSPESFLRIANGSPNMLKNLDAKKWRLLKKDEQKNIQQIETIGTPIGKLFDICVGIATLKDEVFFIDGSKENNGYYLKKTEKGIFEIEKEITKPVYKISDFKGQEDLEKNKRRIICPYTINKNTATVINEAEFQTKYPKCYAYFLTEKENLLMREKGKVTFEPFFAWGRTQGLTKKGIRILNPSFSLKPRFLVVKEEEGFFTNGYGLFFRKQTTKNALFSEEKKAIEKEENIDIVQKILNSEIMNYYITRTSIAIEGGYPCYQKNFIEKFTIPDFSDNAIRVLRSLNTKEEIDNFLIQKYQLKQLSGNLIL